MMITPWSAGQLLVWDTNVQTPLLPLTESSGAGKVSELAEERKDSKYKHLGPAYIFTPIAIETFGAIGPQSRA